MIVKDAFRFIVPLLTFAALAAVLGLYLAGILLLLLAGFVAFFFRNPKREIPQDPRVIVSPADGRVVKIERVGNVTRLSIFLSIFDVHVNRSPMNGRIEAIDYKRGKFKPDCGSRDRKSTRLNSSHVRISYAVFCLKKKKYKGSTRPFRRSRRLDDP